MERMAILSVDGHVKASRAGYRDYIEKAHLADFDEWVKAEEASGMPDSGNLNFAFGIDAQWDSDKRIRELESEGVVGPANGSKPRQVLVREFPAEHKPG